MNLKVLFMLLLYYSLLSLFFVFGSTTMTDYTSETELDVSEFDNSSVMEIESIYDLGDAFGRFFIFLGFGVGLPEDTPTWFNTIFITWQSLMFMLSLGFLYQSIRGG